MLLPDFASETLILGVTARGDTFFTICSRKATKRSPRDDVIASAFMTSTRESILLSVSKSRTKTTLHLSESAPLWVCPTLREESLIIVKRRSRLIIKDFWYPGDDASAALKSHWKIRSLETLDGIFDIRTTTTSFSLFLETKRTNNDKEIFKDNYNPYTKRSPTIHIICTLHPLIKFKIFNSEKYWGLQWRTIFKKEVDISS